MEETILTAVSAVGFPIVVTFYLLTRIERSIDKCTAAINELARAYARREAQADRETCRTNQTETPEGDRAEKARSPSFVCLSRTFSPVFGAMQTRSACIAPLLPQKVRAARTRPSPPPGCCASPPRD